MKNATISLGSICVAAAAITGCAKTTTTVEDTSPVQPTAVLKADFALSGQLMPDSSGTHTVYTRPDKRRIDEDYEYHSWMLKRTIGPVDGARIARPNLNLTWHLDNRKKTIRECPLAGCGLGNYKLPEESEEIELEENTYDLDGDETCPLEPVKRDVTVTRTGHKRILSGHPTVKYSVVFDLVSEDSQGLQDVNKLTLDLWVTEPDAVKREVWSINEQFQDYYLGHLIDPEHPLAKFYVSNVYKAVAAFTGDLDSDREWNTSVSNKLAQIKGYPMAITSEWWIDNKACAEQPSDPEDKTPGFDITNPIESTKDMVGSIFKKNVNKQVNKQVSKSMGFDKGEPLMRFVYEVKSVEVSPQKDSLFEKPYGYAIIDRN